VRKDRTSSLDWLRKAAEQGHVQAQGALGWRYMVGSGARRDDSAAYEWLRRAAERGNTSAQNNLGVLYAQGRGVAADPVEAAKWFRLAAEKGRRMRSATLTPCSPVAGARRGRVPNRRYAYLTRFGVSLRATAGGKLPESRRGGHPEFGRHSLSPSGIAVIVAADPAQCPAGCGRTDLPAAVTPRLQ